MTMNRLTALGSYRALPAKLRGALKLHLLHGMPGLEACTALGIAHPARAWAAERVQRAIRDYTDGNTQMNGAIQAPSCPRGCWDILNNAERADWPAFWGSLTPDRQDTFLDLHVSGQWLRLDDWRDRQAKTAERSDQKTVENDPLKTNDLAGGCELEKRFTNDRCESAVLFDAAHVETLKSPISEGTEWPLDRPNPNRPAVAPLIPFSETRRILQEFHAEQTGVSVEQLYRGANETLPCGKTSVELWAEMAAQQESEQQDLRDRFARHQAQEREERARAASGRYDFFHKPRS